MTTRAAPAAGGGHERAGDSRWRWLLDVVPWPAWARYWGKPVYASVTLDPAPFPEERAVLSATPYARLE